jgi:hypothetical protein
MSQPPILSPEEQAIDDELRTWAWLVDARSTWIDGFRPADLPNYRKALSAYVQAAEVEVDLFKAGWLERAASGLADDAS